MKVLYIGYIMPEEEYSSNSAFSFAAGRFERGVLSGLTNSSDIESVNVFCVEPQSYKFPKGKLWVPSRQLQLNLPLDSAKSMGYINFPFIKHICLYLGLKKEISNWKKRNKDEKKVIVSYNADVPIIQVGLSSEGLNIHYCPMLADIPYYQEVKKEFSVRSFLSGLGHKSQHKNLPRLHSAIVLNENAAIDFHIPKWLLVEGAVSDAECLQKVERHATSEKKKVLYCGALDLFHGTDKILLLAKENSDIEFHVCGRGYEWMHKVISASKKQANLIYHGAVSNVELADIQNQMDLMIIPHPTDLLQLRYQFPSKLMTCMSTGIPVVMTPLPGIPDEYRQYVYIAKSDSIHDLNASIREALHDDKVKERGRLAREFVIKEKNWSVQTDRIIQFWRKL